MTKIAFLPSRVKCGSAALLSSILIVASLGFASGFASAREAMIPPSYSGQTSRGPETDPNFYQPYFQNYSDYKSWSTDAQISRMPIWTMDQGVQWRIIVTPNNY